MTYDDKYPANAAVTHACILLLDNGILPNEAVVNRKEISELTGLTERRLASDIKLSSQEEQKVIAFFNKKK
jgi:hypothetical protein